MRISRKAEYASVAMIELAANFGGRQPVRVKSIADAHRIPLRFLIQILLQLKGAGLVLSTRGASGGYQLTRTPNAISVAEIIGAIDGTPESPPEPESPLLSPAVKAIRHVWQEIQARERQILEEVTLADLVRQTKTADE